MSVRVRKREYMSTSVFQWVFNTVWLLTLVYLFFDVSNMIIKYLFPQPPAVVLHQQPHMPPHKLIQVELGYPNHLPLVVLTWDTQAKKKRSFGINNK